MRPKLFEIRYETLSKRMSSAEENCTAENLTRCWPDCAKQLDPRALVSFVPEEHGGMGLRPLANALVQMELGESFWEH